MYTRWSLSLQELLCVDCDEAPGVSGVASQLCHDCLGKRDERKRTIHEIVDTEQNYGHDLKIILEVCASILNLSIPCSFSLSSQLTAGVLCFAGVLPSHE